jgi:hypothetical protein
MFCAFVDVPRKKYKAVGVEIRSYCLGLIGFCLWEGTTRGYMRECLVSDAFAVQITCIVLSESC